MVSRRTSDAVVTGPGARADDDDGTLPRGPEALFLLVFNDPDAPVLGYGVGWTLTGWRHGVRRWSVALAARGVGAHADDRRAETVAVAVLAEHGIRVTGWHRGADTGAPVVHHAAVVGRDRTRGGSIRPSCWGDGAAWLG